MKPKIIALMIIIVLVFTACGEVNQPSDESVNKFSVVCTVFPLYDWVREILGERTDEFELTLLSNRTDFHNYQPSVDDIVKISTCDLFIYIGGESDTWVDGVLANSLNPNMIVLNLLDILDTQSITVFSKEADKISIDINSEILIVEVHDDDDCGTHDHDDCDTHDHDNCDNHDHDDCDNHDHDHELDEHIWLSLFNATYSSLIIADALSELDSENSDLYTANLDSFHAQIKVLDNKYREMIKNAAYHTLICADRFPFRYLAEAYGLSYFAAFSGCSAETEASFETIIYLAEKIDELGINKIIVTESSDQMIAKTIINNTHNKNQEIFALDSLQSISSSDALQISYLEIMEKNLHVLTEVLN